MSNELQEDEASSRDLATSLFGDYFLKAYEAVPDNIKIMQESELEEHRKPTSIDFGIRRRLWKKVEDSKQFGIKGFQISELYRGICAKQLLYQNILNNPYRLMWILCPFQDMSDQIDEGLFIAIKRVKNELLALPVNEKTAGYILKALDWFANRSSILGPITQQIEQRSMNVTVDGNKMMKEATNPEDLMQKYADLKAKIAELPPSVKMVNEPNED